MERMASAEKGFYQAVIQQAAGCRLFYVNTSKVAFAEVSVRKALKDRQMI